MMQTDIPVSPRVKTRFPRAAFGLAVAVGLLVPAVAIACSVPVFRFALEQWRPDAYQVFVYHDQDLSAEQSRLITQLQRRSSTSAGGETNVQVRAIDLRGEPQPGDRERLRTLGEPSLPQMVVNLPRGIGGGEVRVGAADWNEQEVERLLDSPARKELAQRLIDGQVVWVFLGSGNSQQDDARLTALETELAGLQETLELPAIEPDDLKEMSIEPDALQIRFSALAVKRDDPAEKWFVEMLLSIEPDLRDEELAGEPMVFPVFGRGRALYALVGLGINADMIKEAAEFLTGPCQCTVKAENPGVDLLLPVSWDDFIVPTEPEEVSLPLVGLGNYSSEPPAGLPLLAAAMRDEDSAEVADRSEWDAAGRGAEERPAAVAVAAPVAQADVVDERPTMMLWLPWVVMIILGLVVVAASISFFRRQ